MAGALARVNLFPKHQIGKYSILSIGCTHLIILNEKNQYAELQMRIKSDCALHNENIDFRLMF